VNDKASKAFGQCTDSEAKGSSDSYCKEKLVEPFVKPYWHWDGKEEKEACSGKGTDCASLVKGIFAKLLTDMLTAVKNSSKGAGERLTRILLTDYL